MGHARALLSLESAPQILLANKIVASGLSVRETEKLVQNLLNPAPRHKKARPGRDIIRLQEKVADRLGATGEIRHGAKGAGKLVIEYKTLDQLDGILSKIGVKGNE